MKIWNTKNGYSIFRVLPGKSKAFLISGCGSNILVDTGALSAWDRLKKNLDAIGTDKIDLLILTHTHYDHASNAAKIRKVYGAKVAVNTREASNLEKGENIMPGGTNFLTRIIADKIAPAISGKFNYEPCITDILIDKSLDLKDFGLKAYILHTPGHTTGSQSVIVDDEIALTGDSMFGVFPGSVYPPFADNEDEMIRSWGKLLDTGCFIYLPAHGTENKAEIVKTDYRKRHNSLSGLRVE